MTIPQGYSFLSNQVDGKVYTFVALEPTTVTKSNTNYIFENLLINEGQYTTYRYVHDESSNPKQVYELPDVNVDTETLKVTVSPSVGNTQVQVYEIVTDVTETTETSAVYFLQESRNGKYQIYFGDGIIGKKLPDGAVLTINYLITNGSDANKVNNFAAANPLVDTNAESLRNFTIQVVEVSNGGSDRETVDQIKYSAPLQYVSQNRLVTYKDYEVFIRKNYPNLDSVSIWGGEDDVPPIYGKVFISLKPVDGYYISESEKQRIIDEIIKPKAMVTVSSEYRDPEYLFVNTSVNVQYDPAKTTMSKEAMKQAIRNAVLFYKNTYLDKFNAKFAISKMQREIDAVDTNSIIGSDSTIRLEKRFTPTLNKISNYYLNYNVPLIQGAVFNKLTSSSFNVKDGSGITRTVTLEEVPKSFTGINSIEIIDPGLNYTSEPTVTITGDGFGATAKATILLGKIQKIEITNPGIDYNQAIVTITGGGGFGAVAVAKIDTKIGKLRTIYYTSESERIVVNSNAGDINYDTGTVTLSDINILESKTTDGQVRIIVGSQSNIIESNRNTILTIDEEDPASILINLQTI